VRDVVGDTPCRVVGYGATEGMTGTPWRATSLDADAEGTRFDVLRDGVTRTRAHTPMHGRVNVENSLAALATLDVLGVPTGDAVAALARFRGVKRRLEVRGEAHGVTVLDDFAHHPTAVAASIDAARARFPNRRLIAVFEPRTNTSRRRIFQQRYAEVFDGADRVVVRVVPDAPIYSATGEVTERFSARELAGALAARGTNAVAIDGVDAIVTHVATESRAGDVVLVMSNGDFGGIWEKLLAALREQD
jgi:UDP-N-acetylmuramate: L-alanyl-gamma-D-glutamyl-meso-diaminopimelate ligase